jgi:hypothetical protein
LEALDPSIRNDVLAAAEELRAEHEVQTAVARSLAKQARALEKAMAADLARLAEVAGRIGQ